MESFLGSLRRYRPRENTDSLENFITEAFAWILNNSPELSEELVKSIQRKIDGNWKGLSEYSRDKDIHWSTQEDFNGKRPDMVARWDGGTLVFEHKTWSNLSPNQLENYRRFIEESTEAYQLIIITAHRSQHSQNPDLALCWYDIYELFNDKKDQVKNRNYSWVVDDFLNLLSSEGLGPPAPVRHSSILFYQEALEMKSNLKDLVKRNLEHDWPLDRTKYFAEIQDAFGRLGIQFSRKSDNASRSWKPGIFIGFLLDGRDHSVTHRMKEGLKMALIVSIDKAFHKDYPGMSGYQKLVNELKMLDGSTNDGWSFYDHQGDQGVSPNMWHPLYFEKLMLDVFRGSVTADEQDVRFRAEAVRVINHLVSTDSFVEFENELFI